MRISISLITFFAFLFFGFVPPSVAGDREPGELRVAYWNPVKNLDPVYTTKAEKLMLVDALFEGLVKSEYGEIVLAHAKDIQTSEDGKRYTFKLRDDIFWSDGTPETAGDYVLAFRRLLDPELDADKRPDYLINAIKNVKKIKKGEAPLDSLGVHAEDGKTLVIELESPSSFFVQVLNYPGLVPVPAHMIREYGNDWWKQPKLVSNGEYRLEERKAGEHFTFRRVVKGGSDDKPKLVRMVSVENDDEALQMLMIGELDITHNISKRHSSWLGARLGYKPIKTEMPGTAYVAFNTKNDKLANPNVRRALAMAIDREEIAQALDSKTADTFAVDWMLKHSQDRLVKSYEDMDMETREEMARALLATAGYNDENPLELSILGTEINNFAKVAFAIRSAFFKIGVKAEIVVVPMSEYFSSFASGKFDVTLRRWISDYDDAMTFYSILETGASKNITGFSHPEFDALVKIALETLDVAERHRHYARLENMLSEQAPIVPLYRVYMTATVSPVIKSIGTKYFPSKSIFNIEMATELVAR